MFLTALKPLAITSEKLKTVQGTFDLLLVLGLNQGVLETLNHSLSMQDHRISISVLYPENGDLLEVSRSRFTAKVSKMDAACRLVSYINISAYLIRCYQQ